MAKSTKRKPSFEGSGGAKGGAAWVYRSEAGAAEGVAGTAKARTGPRAGAAGKTAAGGAARVSAAAASEPAPAKPNAAAPGDRARGAQRLVDRYAKYSAAAGLVPVPVADVAAIAAVQVAMLGALAGHYGVPYSRERGKTLVATMLGGLMPALAGHQVLKAIGPLAGMISVSGFAMAATYAIGQLFIAHFESGGTLLDIDVEQSRTALAADLSRP